ncbi:MAG: acetamidase/formamidase family protein [Thermodesulfobacteriota bacterium]|jgi:acetamidase/formamidase
MKKMALFTMLLSGLMVIQFLFGMNVALAQGKTHFLWRHDKNINAGIPRMISAKIPPCLSIDPGDTVMFAARMGEDEQVLPESATDVPTGKELRGIDFDRIHPITGPVFIRGAKPGDILQVEVLDIVPGPFGITWIDPNWGFLVKEFDDYYKHTFVLNYPREEYVEYGWGFRLKLEPMCGIAAVAPPPGIEKRTLYPAEWGGNMDNKDFKRGTTWYFPVFNDGALFSTGDCHATQGDGEVGLAGLECPANILLRFDVIKGRKIPEPQYETETFYATTGTGATMEDAGRKALKYMLDFLVWKFGIPRHEAYMLCSLKGDLRVSEVVDPAIQMHFEFPKDAYVKGTVPKMYGK